jgi:hypothetical protein
MLALAWLGVSWAGLADDSCDLLTSQRELPGCFAASAASAVTSSAPSASYDDLITTMNPPATPTTGDKDSKITK